jgi:hypothetical protein
MGTSATQGQSATASSELHSSYSKRRRGSFAERRLSLATANDMFRRVRTSNVCNERKIYHYSSVLRLLSYVMLVSTNATPAHRALSQCSNRIVAMPQTQSSANDRAWVGGNVARPDITYLIVWLLLIPPADFNDVATRLRSVK